MDGSVGRGLPVEIENKLPSALCLVPSSAGSERTQEAQPGGGCYCRNMNPQVQRAGYRAQWQRIERKSPQEQASQSGRPV